jgi:Domain of unknown function, E. rectale Gene description (DUF3881)
MSEPFDAIGFKIPDEASYQALAEEAHQRGSISRVSRGQGMMCGCCWRLGSGLEVWTTLYEAKEGIFYADCRPAFRSQRLFGLYPWEIVEYEEDGEAIARGADLDSETNLVFQLQNITEIDPADFRERPITAALSGLAYRAQVNTRAGTPIFAPLQKIYPRRKVLENDYAARGRILSWREIKNSHTASDLLVIDVDAKLFKMEVVVNRAELKGELKTGGWLSAEVWLQGHILNDKDLISRYEGIDHDVPRDLIWQKLRREN